MGRFEGTRAIITGGASGIGLATARRLIEEGAGVALIDVDEEKLAAAGSELSASTHLADVADHEALEAAIGAARDALGGLTFLFNNAGAGFLAPLDRYDPEAMRRLFEVNLHGAYHALRISIPLILETVGDEGVGTIVNNASVSGLRPTTGEAPYSAAKAGLIALTKSAALEYGPRIRVNAVLPGFIDTPLTELFARMPGVLDLVTGAAPLGRVGTAEEVADVVLFLASEGSRYVTGQCLCVDGGLSLPQAGIDQALAGALEMIGG